MRRPGREFGSEKPKVIYVALRWNDHNPKLYQEQNMVEEIASRLSKLAKHSQLNVKSSDLRIYNLVKPGKGRGMGLAIDEVDEVEETINSICQRVKRSRNVHTILVGGKSGPMPFVALSLKLLLPKVNIQLRYHHSARAFPLELIRKM